MGRIKTKAVKRASRQLVEKSPEIFNKEFEHNKKILGSDAVSSKKVRNMIAGYITRIKKNTKSLIQEEQ